MSDNNQHDRDTDKFGVVDLQSGQEVDWMAEGRRDQYTEYDCNQQVQTPDGEGIVIARFVMDNQHNGREITAERDSPTYVVQLPESERPHPTYDEDELTEG